MRVSESGDAFCRCLWRGTDELPGPIAVSSIFLGLGMSWREVTCGVGLIKLMWIWWCLVVVVPGLLGLIPFFFHLEHLDVGVFIT